MPRIYPDTDEEIRLGKLLGGDGSNRITPWTEKDWKEFDDLHRKIFQNSSLAGGADSNVTARKIHLTLQGEGDQAAA